jgi:hypothetical protein
VSFDGFFSVFDGENHYFLQVVLVRFEGRFFDSSASIGRFQNDVNGSTGKNFMNVIEGEACGNLSRTDVNV